MEEIERLAHGLAESLAYGSHQDAVRDLLKAIREPTEAMQRAGFLANVHKLPDGGRVTMPADKAWRAIIDEILK